jgi:non-ribosomal peptide synthetase component F
MDLIAVQAARQPHRPALIEDERSLTWEQFFRTRNRLAHALAGLGLGAGQHAIVYAHNALENLVVGAALRALGAIGVPMNHRLTAEEVAYILDNADATAVFVGDAFLPMAERVRGAARVKHWITVGAERRPWAEALDDLLARGSEAPPPAPPAIGGSMVYTAGTTGKPKGALRRVTDPAAILPRLAALDCLDPAQVHLVAGPLYHSAPGGFALYAQMVGGTVVVMRKFDPQEALRLVERHRCTTTFMAPTLLKRIVDLPAEVRARYDVSSMRSLVIAAAPCPMRVKEQALAMFGPVLYEFYGSTELGVNTVLRPEDVLRKPGSCGRAAPGVELAILDTRHARRAVRAPVQRRVRRVLPQPGGHGADLARRVDVGGRRGVDGRRGLRLYLRPQAGHDHLGRREHLSRRDRGRAASSSRRRGRRGLRRARPRVGRARARGHPATRRSPGDRSRADGVLSRARRRLQDAARGVVSRGLPPRHRRQARQAPAARALLGRPDDARVGGGGSRSVKFADSGNPRSRRLAGCSIEAFCRV